MDKGHEKLVADLEKMLAEAKAFQFHDFKNTDYKAPKIVLADRFRIMRRDTINGKYDN